MKWTHQQLGGSQDVQVQALDPGVVDPHLPVDPRALDTDEHPEVGGQPGGSWRDETPLRLISISHSRKNKSDETVCLQSFRITWLLI